MAIPRQNLVALLVAFVLAFNLGQRVELLANGEQLELSSILPKLNSMHEETKSLLIKNSDLRDKILTGLKAQDGKTMTYAKDTNQTQIQPSQYPASNTSSPVPTNSSSIQQQQQQQNGGHSSGATMTRFQKGINSSEPQTIDYEELEEFNRWVGINLDYAVENTLASAEALKEEARHNNGTVDYSLEAINDGLEGVKYWQSAVEFQDKTLKNEKFDKAI